MRVSALVITWNSAGVVGEMLESLSLAAAGLDVELVHIDNASDDESLHVVAQAWPGNVVQQANARNVGFARALKQGIERAGGDAVLMLNPDVRMRPDSLRVLLDRLDSDQGLGAAGPLLRRATGDIDWTCARREPRLVASLAAAFGLAPLVRGTRLDLNTYPRPTYSRERDVPCLSGAAMLIRASALEATGGFDDRLFMYFEDIDICARLSRHGYRLRYCPSAEMTHIFEASSPRDETLQAWLAAQSEAATHLYFATYRGPAAAATHRMLVAIQGALRVVAGVVRRDAGARRVGRAKLRWGVTGKMPRGGPPAADAYGRSMLGGEPPPGATLR